MTSTIPGTSDEIRIDPSDWDRAIADAGGPQLVVAGPGTGKTEFLVRRAAHLISEVVDRADRVLILTFSRRAAADVRARVGTSVPGSLNRVAASTFHSFAHRLLEAHRGSVPALLTGPEQVALVGDLLSDEDPSDWPVIFRPLLGSHTLARDVTDFLLRCSERLIDPDTLEGLATERADWRALPGFARRYTAALERYGRIDYGTLLMRAVELTVDDGISARLAEDHPFVLVDEWQDTSPAQAELAERLSRRHRNITVAGDPYQSVYSFRGAELGNVARFPERFRDLDGTPARRLVLTTSFRVPAEILDAALRVTSRGELPGAAGPVRPAAHVGSVEALVFDQGSAEAEWIAREVERLHLVDGVPYRRMAVVVRSKRRLLPELSRALDRRRIPHDAPDTRLVDHPAVQMLFDLARGAVLDGHDTGTHPEADRIARRLLLGPLFELPLAQERHLLRRRRRETMRWSALIRAELGADGQAVADLLSDASWARDISAVDGFWRIWETLPHIERMVGDPARRDDRAAWSAFAQALERQAERDRNVSLVDYWHMTAEDDFEATPLLSHAGSPTDRLTLTTLHQSKGLEFDVVFVADASEGVFPDLRRGVSLLQTHALSPDVGTSAADMRRFRVQEEMRLAYTATTRARRRVVWTATKAGIDEGEQRPSRFLLAVAGVESADSLVARHDREGPPITAREAQAHLRRLLADPAAPAPRRLAAAEVLARPARDLWNASRFAGLRLPGPDTGVIEPGMVFSPSQAESYASCPRQYVFERRLGIGDVTSPSAVFGSLVHETLERAERRSLDLGEPRSTLDRALKALEQVWDEQANFGAPAFDERWKQKATEVLHRLYGEWPTDSGPPVDLERDLQMELDGHSWVGRADRIERLPDGRLRIVDYKTGGTPTPIAEAAQSLQLGFYLLAAQSDAELCGMGDPAEAELWFPRATAKTWRRAFDPDRLPDVEERLSAIANDILEERWEPALGDACRWCRVRSVCPLWPEGREAYLA